MIVTGSYLEINQFESFHDCWVELIDNLGQVFLPELVSIFLADCDGVVSSGLQHYCQILHHQLQ